MLPVLHLPLHVLQRSLAADGDDDCDLQMTNNQQVDRARQLAFRFAHMLAHRQRLSQLNNLAQANQRPTKNRKRSKNCSTRRKRHAQMSLTHQMNQWSLRDDDLDHRYLDVDTIGRSDEGNELVELDSTLRRLQDNISAIERSVLLRDSRIVTWRTNRSAVAVNLCREYHRVFTRGFDPSNSSNQQTITTRLFMERVFEQDNICRDFQGQERFLSQWEKHTIFYDDIHVCLRGIKLVDDRDQWISVACMSEMRVVFTIDTLKYLYPVLYQQMISDPHARTIADKLVGQAVPFAFDLVLHFNCHGRVFAHESRMHIVPGLLDVLKDPFATIRVVECSLMNADGHWNAQQDLERQERLQKLPAPIL